MKGKFSEQKARLNLIAATILAVGLASSVVIYLTAWEPPENVLIYQTDDFKKYTHDLELYGGKANVLAVRFREWFDGLWHGTSLAYTVGVITVVVALGFFFVAHHTPTDEDVRDGHGTDGNQDGR